MTHLLRYLQLEDRVQGMMTSGLLSETHGKRIAGLPRAFQFRIAQECVRKQWSTRALEKAIQSCEGGNPGLVSKSSTSTKDVDRLSLEKKLADIIGNKVSIECTAQQKGYLKLHFHSLDELDGHLERLGLTVDEL